MKARLIQLAFVAVLLAANVGALGWRPVPAHAAALLPGTITTEAGAPGSGLALGLGQVPFSLGSGGDHVYVGDAANPVVRDLIYSTGAEGVLAGDDGYGYTGHGGQATSSMINGAGAIAHCGTDTYFADTYNYVIRKVDVSGQVTTVAGTGQPGDSGDGGLATSAQLSRVFGLACRTGGGLYISDSDNGAVRILTPDGLIHTWYYGFGFPTGISEGGGTDYLYVVDTATSEIWVISDIYPPRIIAGTGVAGYNGEGRATTSELNHPLGLVQHGSYLYVADTDNNRIREVDIGQDGIGTISGTGAAGFSGDQGLAPAAELNRPEGVLYYTSACGDQLLIADTGNNRVRDIAFGSCGGPLDVITTIAGNGSPSWSGDGGQATAAEFGKPYAVAYDGAGNEYVADNQNNVVRKITATGVVSTVAGEATQPPGFSGDGGLATSAQLNEPRGLVVNSAGDIFFVDAANQRVREIDHTSQIITTIAGNGTAGFSGDGGPAISASLNWPDELAIDGSGNLYIADSLNNRIRKFTAGGTITTYAGDGTKGFSGDTGPATQARLNAPIGLAFDSAGNLYFTDGNNNRVRRVDHATGLITTVAGTGFAGLSGDGHLATQAELDSPTGLVFDRAGNLDVSDPGNGRIRQVTPQGLISSMVGVCGVHDGFSGDGGPAAFAWINFPSGLAVDQQNNLYIADVDNNRVREVFNPPGGREAACPGPAGIAGMRQAMPGPPSAGGPRFPLLARGSRTGTGPHLGTVISKPTVHSTLPSRTQGTSAGAIRPSRDLPSQRRSSGVQGAPTALGSSSEMAHPPSSSMAVHPDFAPSLLLLALPLGAVPAILVLLWQFRRRRRVTR